MKILLDENIPHDLRGLLPSDDVFTVQFLGWNGIRNGDLMKRAQQEGFAAILTLDRGFSSQKPQGVTLRVAVIKTKQRDPASLLAALDQIIAAVMHGQASDLVDVF